MKIALFRVVGQAVLALLVTMHAPALADVKTFGVTSYDRVEVRGDMIVEILPDHRITARAEGSRAALETLSLDVRDRTLRISQLSHGAYGPRLASDGPLRIRLTAQNLAGVSLRGAGQVRASGLRGREVYLHVAGAGRIEADVPAGEDVRLTLSGDGGIIVTGRARRVDATLSGAGGIDAEGLMTRDLAVRSSGSGASRFAASDAATINASGDGTVEVTGRARCTVTNSGAGNVACSALQRRSLPGG